MRSARGIVFTILPLDVYQKWITKNLARKNNHEKATKNFQFMKNFDFLGESCKIFQNPGRNCHFLKLAGTRCAQNSQICKTLPLFQSWVESVNLHKLQGPEMNILQFLRKFSQFRSWVFSANISKLQGLIEKFYHFSQLLSPFRN